MIIRYEFFDDNDNLNEFDYELSMVDIREVTIAKVINDTSPCSRSMGISIVENIIRKYDFLFDYLEQNRDFVKDYFRIKALKLYNKEKKCEN